MDEKAFCYWLQGFVEMNPDAMITHTQWEILKDHLKLTMNKQTPYRFPSIGTPGILPVQGPVCSTSVGDSLSTTLIC